MGILSKDARGILVTLLRFIPIVPQQREREIHCQDSKRIATWRKEILRLEVARFVCTVLSRRLIAKRFVAGVFRDRVVEQMFADGRNCPPSRRCFAYKQRNRTSCRFVVAMIKLYVVFKFSRHGFESFLPTLAEKKNSFLYNHSVPGLVKYFLNTKIQCEQSVSDLTVTPFYRIIFIDRIPR